MKICAIICEFNPFHNGHKYLIEQAKKRSGCDKIICIMSGSFTQRGELCVMDKFTRAKHAILCGTDCVLELPTAFTVAPAEIFAAGAVKILSSIPEITAIAFGCESPETDFIQAAEFLNGESQLFKKVLTEQLADGESYIKSYAAAFEACGGEKNLLSRPNNILGVEYAKAIVKSGANISVLPVKRIGGAYDDGELCDSYSSAKAIRNNAQTAEVKDSVPDCVYTDLNDFLAENSVFEYILRYKLICTDAKTLRRVYGCNEGLENKLLSLSHLSVDELIAEANSRRYPSSRIKRILTANALNLFKDDCDRFLRSPLYIKPLAVKKEFSDEIMAALAKSEFPTIARQRDLNALNYVAKMCFECDISAYRIWKLIARRSDNSFDYPIFI